MAAHNDITLTEAACLAPLGQALLEEETTIGRLKAEKVGFLRSVCLRVWAAQLQLASALVCQMSLYYELQVH